MKTIKLFIIFTLSLFAFQQANAQYTADFYYSVLTDSCWGQEIQFMDSSFTQPGQGASYWWDFGDGSNSTAMNPSHWYYQPGAYTVEHHVMVNLDTFIVTETIYIQDQSNPVGMGYSNLGSPCTGPFAYSFVGIPSNPNNPITNWEWYINNNYAGNGQNLIYTFTTPGVYNVNVIAWTANGCVSEAVESVLVGGTNLNVAAAYQIINSTCNGTLVDLISTVSGGNAPYTYTWTYASGASTVANPQQVFVQTQISQVVELTITDVNGCQGFTQISIPNNANIISTFATANPVSACSSSCDGSLTAFATGSTGPYTFVLTPGNITQVGYQVVFDNLCAGSYNVQVYDQNQCFAMSSAIVAQDTLGGLVVDAAVTTSNSCNSNNNCDAAAEVFVSGGVSPYTYSLDFGSTFQSSNIFSGLCAGTYQVTAQDANGCQGYYAFYIAPNQDLGAQYSEYYSTCSGNQGNSSIQVYPYGGVAPYSFLWSDGSSFYTLMNPNPGPVSVIITDANGCTYSQTFNVPTNDCYTISGNVYVDVNGNCIYDSTDYPLSCWVDLTATAGGPWLYIYDYTDANGAYSINAAAGTYFFDINGYNTSGLTPVCPNANYSVTLDSTNQSATVDFFLSPPAPVQDLSISIGHITNVAPSTVPGQNRWSYIYICNNGNLPMSGYAEWHYSDELTYAGPPSWSNIVPDIIDQVNHVLTFNFSNLLPGQCQQIRINFDVPNTMAIGTPIIDEAFIYPLVGDVTPSNNSAYTFELSVGSWDPNDKSVYPNGDITVDDNDHNYHIRFQNEGNANATRVIVKDELDQNLALHSLRDVQASHDFIMTVENDNTLVFTFNNIQLPPKDVDEAASQGYVAFSLTQEGDLPVGTQIENTAAIYFDYNEAVITNTVVNTIVEKTTGILNALDSKLKVHPNPSLGNFIVNLDNDLSLEKVKVYDLMGNVILTLEGVQTKEFMINLSNSSAGVYLLEVTTAQGVATQKLIKR